MNISKRVITQLENSDWFDRLLLLFGMLMFCSVVLYIIKKRTYDVGISWISWITQTKKGKKVITVTTSIVAATSTLIQQPTETTLEAIIETISPVIVETIRDEL